MGKADRNRNETARARVAAQQQAARKAEARRRMLLAGGGVAVVLLVVLGIVLGKVLSKSSAPPPGPATEQLPASVQGKVMSVPASTLAAVGAGAVQSGSFKLGSGPALTSNGKPEMLYIGAEWCPYCAAERWAMAVALSRFGTFSPLRGIHSSSTDVYPNTATLTFYKSTYTSNYVDFAAVENEDVNKNLLQKPTAAQQALWTKFEPPGTGFPFIDIGNKIIAAATYNPQVLKGLTWSQIATDLHNPSSPVAQGALGSANVFTAAICKITGNRPGSVCSTPLVSSLESKL
jgi:thiol-disulfide isomerase/thioredoxin